MAGIKAIRVHVPKNVLALTANAVGTYQAYIDVAIKDMGRDAEKLAKGGTPVGAYGKLRDSVNLIYLPFGFRVKWTAPYAEAVQYGTKPHWVPIAPLIDWVRVKLGSVDRALPYKVQAKIARAGTRGKHYLEPIRSKVYQSASGIFRARMQLLAKVLSGNLGAP